MIKEIVPDLSHCCKESLSVEESSHPESNGSAIEAPGMELAVSVNQLCKPEPKGTGIPWNLSQNREIQNKFQFQKLNRWLCKYLTLKW